MTTSAGALCSRLCTGARTSSAGSSGQLKGREGSHCRTCALIATNTHLKITSGGLAGAMATAKRRGRSSVTGGARHAAATSVGRTRPESVTQDRAGPTEAKVFRARAPLQGQCKTLMCALKQLANLQTGGANLVDTIFQGLQGQSRLKITHEPRRFIEVANHEAVKIGDLEKNSEAMKVVRPKVQQGEWANRRGERAGILCTLDRAVTSVGDTFTHHIRSGAGSQPVLSTFWTERSPL